MEPLRKFRRNSRVGQCIVRSNGGRHAHLEEDVRQPDGEDEHLGLVQSQVNTLENEVGEQVCDPSGEPVELDRERELDIRVTFPLKTPSWTPLLCPRVALLLFYQRNRSVSGCRLDGSPGNAFVR